MTSLKITEELRKSLSKNVLEHLIKCEDCRLGLSPIKKHLSYTCMWTDNNKQCKERAIGEPDSENNNRCYCLEHNMFAYKLNLKKQRAAVIIAKREATQLVLNVLSCFGTGFWPDLIEYLEDKEFNKNIILEFIEENKEDLIEFERYEDIKSEIEELFKESGETNESC